MKMKILLTGKNGQLGWELRRTLLTLGDVIDTDSKTMNLADPDAIRSSVRKIKPQLIVNAAAYTAVDKAEEEPELAMAINGVAPGILAEEAKRLNAAIVHYSTDYVFDGKGSPGSESSQHKGMGAPLPYLETDEPNPLNVYGKTKLAGDRAVQAIGVPHLIFRTGWVYGVRGKNFLLTILRLAQERKELKIVNDQIGAPNWSRLIAEITVQVLIKCAIPAEQIISRLAQVSGVYNLASSGQTSWYGFAKAIIEHIKDWDVSPSTPEILSGLIPITSAEYPLPAKRPAFSRLDCNKLKNIFGFSMPEWDKPLMLVLDEIIGKN